MDPLSVTLAAVTLATAIKDIVELAERIESSFAKVSQNLRNAQVLAIEILKTVNKLKEFCDEHHEVLNASNETRTAVRDLHTKMSSTYTNCIQLLPASSDKRLGRFRIRLQTWKHRDEIETAISNLKNDVKDCYTEFMLFALIRMESKLDAIHHANNQDSRFMKRELFSALRVPDRNVIALAGFVPSISMPLVRPPSDMDITGDAIGDIYLRAQIKAIVGLLARLSSMDLTLYSIKNTRHHDVRPLSVSSENLFVSYDQNDLHRHTVTLSLQIQRILANQPTTASIQVGACYLIHIAIGLRDLMMYEEAMMIGQWTVKLFRMLSSVDQEIFTPDLILGLTILAYVSIFNANTSNLETSLLAIEEAAELSRVLQTPTAPFELRIQYGRTLMEHAKGVNRKSDHVRAIKLAEDAVNIFEDVLDINDRLYEPCSKVDGIFEVNPDFLHRLLNYSAVSSQDILSYGRALNQLSKCLDHDGHFQKSLDVKLRALPIFRALLGLYGPNPTIDGELAGLLRNLTKEEYRNLLPSNELLTYAEGCLQIYYKYAFENTALYGRSLCDALWMKADILGRLRCHDDALEVWMELVKLVKKLLEDQIYLAEALYEVSASFRRLKRHDEAANTLTQSILTCQPLVKTTSFTQANAYYDLAGNLRHAGRYQEAIQAGHNAVAQFRALALENMRVDPWTEDVGDGLNELASAYLCAGQYEDALSEGHEAMKIFEKINSEDPIVIQCYLRCLRVNLDIASASDNESRAVERSKDIIRHLRALAAGYPEMIDFRIWRAEVELGRNMNKFNHVPEAHSHLEGLLANWDAKYQCAGETDMITLHISTLTAYASILDEQGYPELALTPLRKALDIGCIESLSLNEEDIAYETLGAMSKYVHILCYLGRYADALEDALKALGGVRENKGDSLNDLILIGSLQAVAHAAIQNYKLDEAIEVAQEAVDISRGPYMEEHIKSIRNGEYCSVTSWRAFFHLPESLEFLARALLVSGKASDALVHAKAAVEEALKLKSVGRMSWLHAEPVYMSARDCLADCLVENGNITEAIDQLVELRKYYTERAKPRNKIYSNLAQTLRRLGILYCSVGRHEDGIAAANELTELKTRLTDIFPSLAQRIDFDMEKTLKKANLECHHQPVSFEEVKISTKDSTGVNE